VRTLTVVWLSPRARCQPQVGARFSVFPQADPVYESLYGNTAAVGEAIATSVRDHGLEVNAGSVCTIDPAKTGEADLLVIGVPTHVHGLSAVATRTTAAADRTNTFAEPTIYLPSRHSRAAAASGSGPRSTSTRMPKWSLGQTPPTGQRKASDAWSRCGAASPATAQASWKKTLRPSRSVAFEDSPIGVRAARDAGLAVVYVPSDGQPADADIELTGLDDPRLLVFLDRR